jgi:hypothetical protein
MHPESKREKSRGHQRQHKDEISKDVAAAKGSDDSGDDSRAWKKDEVDLGVSKPPEEMLVEKDVAPDSGIEELRSDGSIKQQHGARKHD